MIECKLEKATATYEINVKKLTDSTVGVLLHGCPVVGVLNKVLT